MEHNGDVAPKNHYDIDTNPNTVPLFVHHNLQLNHHKLSRVALNQKTVTS